MDRQEYFKGDLNLIQQMGLGSLMDQEMKDKIDLEKFRALNTALATNPGTSRDYIMNMLEEHEPEEVVTTDPEWTTPESIEEIEKFLRNHI